MKIDTNKLKTALTLLKPGLSKKEIISNANCYLFKNNKIITYNDEVCFTYPIEDCGSEFAVVSDELIKLVEKTKVDEISMELSESSLIFRAGKAKAGFKIIENDFPIDGKMFDEIEWKPIPEDFATALRFAAMSASDDYTNPIINCVHISNSGEIEGTNNYRLSYWNLNQEMPINETLIPADNILKALTIQPTEISKDKDWVHFRNIDEVTASCRVLNETFPNVKHVLSGIVEGTDVVFPDKINEILDKASVFTTKEDVAKSVTITYKKNYLFVESESEAGFFKERVPMDIELNEFSFMINPTFLKDVLKRTNKCNLYNNMLTFKGDNWVYIAMLKIKK